MAAKRDTVLLRHEWIGSRAKPSAIVITYRSRLLGRNRSWSYRSVILDGGPKTMMLDWPNATAALQGHERLMAKLKRNEPILEADA